MFKDYLEFINPSIDFGSLMLENQYSPRKERPINILEVAENLSDKNTEKYTINLLQPMISHLNLPEQKKGF